MCEIGFTRRGAKFLSFATPIAGVCIVSLVGKQDFLSDDRKCNMDVGRNFNGFGSPFNSFGSVKFCFVVAMFAMISTLTWAQQNVIGEDYVLLTGSTSPSLVERMRVTQGGLTGMGLTNPSYTLDVSGTVRATRFIGDVSALSIPATDKIVSATTGITAQSGGVISITTNGTTANYFDTAGRLVTPGISVTTANGISSTNGYFQGKLTVGGLNRYGNTLHVESATGSVALINSTASNTTSWISLSNSYDNKAFSIGYINNNNNPFLVFNYDLPIGSGVTRMALTNAGRLGIGTTTPRAMLDSASGAILNGIAVGACPYDSCYEAANSWPFESMQLQSSNNLRIFFGPNQRFIFGNAGDALKPGGGSWSGLSDKRLKNVDGAYTHGLKELSALNPVRFHYKKNNALQQPSEREYVGLIAQEVKPYFPEAVTQGKDGYYRLDTTPISFAVINALKELKTENDTLRDQLRELNSANDTLRRDVEALKNYVRR